MSSIKLELKSLQKTTKVNQTVPKHIANYCNAHLYSQSLKTFHIVQNAARNSPNKIRVKLPTTKYISLKEC